MAIQSDGKILAAGESGYLLNGTSYYDFTVARYNTNGTLDTSFDTDGVSFTDNKLSDFTTNISVQSNGKIYLGGISNSSFAVVKLNSNGTEDITFGNSTSGASSYAIGNLPITVSFAYPQSDNKVVVAGTYTDGGRNDIFVARLNSDGRLDTSFGASGVTTTAINTNNNIVSGVLVQNDNKIIVIGATNNGTKNVDIIMRYNGDGTLDTSFGTNGITKTSIGLGNNISDNIKVLSDGSYIVLGGAKNNTNWDITLTKYTSGGLLDANFGNGNGYVILNLGGNETSNYIDIAQDGKILILGAWTDQSTFQNLSILMAQFNSDGTLDTSFGKVNTAPSITSPTTATTPENVSTTTAVYTATGTDPDAGTTLTYSITGGADANLFNINS